MKRKLQMKKTLLLVISSLSILFLLSCSKSSKISGIATNQIDGSPLVGVMITAQTNTNIKEDKKYEIVTTTTDNNGEFTLKGLSDKYQYTLFVSSPEYISNTVTANPPEKGQTMLLERNITACPSPNKQGIFIYKNGIWEELNFNNVIQTVKIENNQSKFEVPFIQTNLNSNPISRTKLTFNYPNPPFPATEWIEGRLSIEHKIPNAIKISNNEIISFWGNLFANYEISGLYLIPQSNVYDQEGANGYPGSFKFAEGLYAGISGIRGRGNCCRYLTLDLRYGIKYELSKLCNNRVSDFRYGFLNLPSNAYFVIHQKNSNNTVLLQTN